MLVPTSSVSQCSGSALGVHPDAVGTSLKPWLVPTGRNVTWEGSMWTRQSRRVRRAGRRLSLELVVVEPPCDLERLPQARQGHALGLPLPRPTVCLPASHSRPNVTLPALGPSLSVPSCLSCPSAAWSAALAQSVSLCLSPPLASGPQFSASLSLVRTLSPSIVCGADRGLGDRLTVTTREGVFPWRDSHCQGPLTSAIGSASDFS